MPDNNRSKIVRLLRRSDNAKTQVIFWKSLIILAVSSILTNLKPKIILRPLLWAGLRSVSLKQPLSPQPRVASQSLIPLRRPGYPSNITQCINSPCSQQCLESQPETKPVGRICPQPTARRPEWAREGENRQPCRDMMVLSKMREDTNPRHCLSGGRQGQNPNRRHKIDHKSGAGERYKSRHYKPFKNGGNARKAARWCLCWGQRWINRMTIFG